MISSCDSHNRITSGLLASRPCRAFLRGTVAGQAGRFSTTATMKHSDISKLASDAHLPLIDRIMCRVWQEDNSGCWIWLGCTNDFQRAKGTNSRPVMRHNGKPRRLVYYITFELFKSKIPTGLWVLHRCDNALCVNPAHLFLGTNSDNMRDCAAKGRHPMLNNPAVQRERARQLGLRNTWSKGSKRPNRKKPMKLNQLAGFIALANLAAVRGGGK